LCSINSKSNIECKQLYLPGGLPLVNGYSSQKNSTRLALSSNPASGRLRVQQPLKATML